MSETAKKLKPQEEFVTSESVIKKFNDATLNQENKTIFCVLGKVSVCANTTHTCTFM